LRPRLSTAGVPVRLGAHRPRQGLIHRIGPGLCHLAHAPSAVGGVEHGSDRARTNSASDQRRCVPGLRRGLRHRLGQRQQPRHIGQVDAAGIAPFRAEERHGQRNARMGLLLQPADAGDGIGRDLLDRELLVDDAVDEGGIGAVFP
jgi:hypothetical protein